MQKKLKYAGIVKFDGKRYVFVSKRGVIFNIIQNAQAKHLAVSGELCIFESIHTKNPDEKLGQIVKIIGKGGDPIPEGRAIVDSYGLNVKMPSDVKSEVARVPNFVSAKDCENFADLRHIPFVTIDPDSAKDYDDAVYACKNPDGTYTLKVAIANVSHYVPFDSSLFTWALENGNSKYLGATVYPMLPEKLSNGICSLNEGVDRLTMCTTCTINPDGSLKDYKIEPAVINSRHRLTYKEADFIHFGRNASGDKESHSGLVAKTLDVRDSLDSLLEVADILFEARMKRGAFDIDSKELEFTLSPDGAEVLDYSLAHNEVYTSVIEETAVITNEIWGEIAQNLGLPFNYRNHEIFRDDKIAKELQAKLKPFNLYIPTGFNGKNIQKVINSVKGKRIEDYIVSVLLASMKAADYSYANMGHVGLGIRRGNVDFSIDTMSEVEKARSRYFKNTGTPYGLAFEGDISHTAYGHTTSPIRRGSDLVNQTQFMSIIMDNNILFSESMIDDASKSFNYNEKISKMAESDYNDMLLALWAKNHIGHTFTDCYISEIGADHAVISTQDGIKMNMSFKNLDFSKKYLKIGKELKSITISSVGLNPAVVNCMPTAVYARLHGELLDERQMN